MRVKCILRLHVNATCLQVFRQGVWIHLVYHVSAAERSSYLAAQHLGIAARDIDLVFLVCQPSCKLLPSIHQLYLVQEEDGTTVVHLLIASLDQIEVAQLQGVYAVVLEVEIQEVLRAITRAQYVVHLLEPLACVPALSTGRCAETSGRTCQHVSTRQTHSFAPP